MREVLLWTGAGQIGMAIARRMGYGKKIVIGDKNPERIRVLSNIIYTKVQRNLQINITKTENIPI